MCGYKDIHGSWQDINIEVVNFKTESEKHLASVGVVKEDQTASSVAEKPSRSAILATFILYVSKEDPRESINC